MHIKQPITVEFSPGEHIDSAAAHLVLAAKAHGIARGKFNDIEMHASANSSVPEVVAAWKRDMDAQIASYRKSPEGLAAAAAATMRKQTLQSQYDELMLNLPTLDMGNDIAVLDWLCAMQEPSDHIGVIGEREIIVGWFEKHGYVVGANCGKDYRPGNRDNEFRYIVGQALDGLQTIGAIHGLTHKFVDEWKAQFLYSRGSDLNG